MGCLFSFIRRIKGQNQKNINSPIQLQKIQDLSKNPSNDTSKIQMDFQIDIQSNESSVVNQSNQQSENYTPKQIKQKNIICDQKPNSKKQLGQKPNIYQTTKHQEESEILIEIQNDETNSNEIYDKEKILDTNNLMKRDLQEFSICQLKNELQDNNEPHFKNEL